MAIAFDANLGATDANGTSPVNLTTIATAAAASRVVVLVSWFAAAGQNVTGVSVGGTAAARDVRNQNGSDWFDVWSVHLPAGLASASTIAVTWSTAVSVGGQLVGAASFTGVSTGAVVTTSTAAGTGTAWSSGSATNTGVPDAVYVGGAGDEDATNPTTSTATSGTEIHDRYRVTDGQGFATGYKIVSTVASDSITGNFSNANSTANTGGLVIYGAAAAGGVTRAFNAIPFM